MKRLLWRSWRVWHPSWHGAWRLIKRAACTRLRVPGRWAGAGTVAVPSVGGLVCASAVAHFKRQHGLASEVEPPFKPALNTGLRLEPPGLCSDLKYLRDEFATLHLKGGRQTGSSSPSPAPASTSRGLFSGEPSCR